MTAKLMVDMKAWDMSLKQIHNHESGVVTENYRVSRVQDVCSSTLLQLPRDTKPELTPVLSLTTEKNSIDVSTDLLHSKLVYNMSETSSLKSHEIEDKIMESKKHRSH